MIATVVVWGLGFGTGCYAAWVFARIREDNRG
ncbi:MAG: hypothetical protein JWO69_2025 [Thermoleophilia bacterium]|nr:hypothetical protein [Thermoleophilia bacterium]